MEVKFLKKNIDEILVDNRLRIPSYQRPYKWKRKQIRNLFYDVKEVMKNNKKTSYHIGTLILYHNKDGKLDVVDGQQRLLSISLLLFASDNIQKFNGAKNLLNQEFGIESCQNAKENFNEWQNLIELVGKKESFEIICFLLNQCYLSVIELPKEGLSEAFQLFDSQNNRGKSLEPYDLLKAFHLRSISAEHQTEETVSGWESIVNNEVLNLKDLFDKHLFRIRRWSNGETGLTQKRYGSFLRFTEDFIDDFKGVNLSQKKYPYLEIYRLLKENNQKFSLSLTMPIINGQNFFEYIEASHRQLINIQQVFEPFNQGNVKVVIGQKANKYQRNINLFFNTLALFIDRFGESSLNHEIVEVILIWAYYPRKAKRIMDSTLAKYAAGGHFQNQETQKLLKLLNESLTPEEFLLKIDRDKFDNWNIERLIKEIIK
ncbi:DUF7834 domain-containing protein [Streptococcus zalophi]|uniref:DUF262 domain-containing protein n=1 Tax=Streptococcus zalophi TaxID=640031 RepID=A0A934P8U6_9STRE|nr:DUF262 domain-containing protein [Streptococcus zalophi]